MRGCPVIVVVLALTGMACSPSTYTVGGTVTGLQGTGLVLQSDGTGNLTISKNGSFTMPNALTAKTPYLITVLTQPSSPTQTCTVTSGSGSIVAANVTNVAVACTTAMYPVGGVVTGLAGTGLVLEDNGGDDLAVSANGTFTFATSVANGGAYAVTVKTQPSMPTQSCAVTSGSGTVGIAAVTGVAVSCTTSLFTVGGAITGLTGSGLTLEDNGGDDLTVSSGSTFTFATALASGSSYLVTVKTQPSGPTQSCTVSGSAGTVGSGNVTAVTVNCATNNFTVGGVVTGLAGKGLVLQNNDSDNLSITGNGLFAFATPLASGGAYVVTVATQPGTPTQTCTVTGGTGTIASSNVSSVVISCATTTYALSGTITGLVGTGLVLQDNGGDNVTPMPADTTFAFATPLASGASYAIAVATQPTDPNQTCVVSADASGAIASAAITDIVVTCTTNAYAVGGVVTGLTGAGLVLQDNGGDNLKITGNGAFTFAKPVDSLGAYAVTVLTQPSTPTQTCVVTGGSGKVVGSAIGAVTVNCATNEYTVSGTVSGLTGTGLAVSLNGAPGLLLGMNGEFSFPQTLTNGTTYKVTIAAQPTSPSQQCTLAGATATIAAANVSNVDVTCTTTGYPVTVNVTGVAGTGLTLQDNGGDGLAVPSSGTYTFATLVASGTTYAVTVSAQPSAPGQTCQVANGAGTIGAAGISNVTVSCVTNAYAVGGSITGLAGTIVLQDNASDTLIVTGSGGATVPFTFAAPVASGAPYAVTVFQQPGSPAQTCTVANGTGTMANAAVSTVAITCTTNSFTLGATIVGLIGTGLVLADDVGDTVPVTQNGVITFATSYASGATYTVSVATQPSGPAQTCNVLGGSGTVGTSNVTGITVNCSTNQYTLSGTVAGLAGAGLVLADNAGDSLPISGNGMFSFPTSYSSGASYAVTVQAQPTSPWQTCTAVSGTASGTIGATNVTNIAFVCVATSYTVSVNVNGLTGGGLQLVDNASDTLMVSANGLSTFALPVASRGAYAVTVLAQPTSPWQTCTVTAGTGTIAGANVTVGVSCTTNTYPVSVNVTGLSGTGLKFWNNGGNGLSVTANGTFPFTTAITSGGVYDVTVLTQPSSPTQSCVVSAPSGTVAGTAVTVSVACTTSSFTVGGTIAGLAGAAVILQDNTSTNTVSVSVDGTFTFPAQASGSAYAVTVATQPTSPWQTCTVVNGTGTVTTANVANVAVTCTTNTYAVSVNVSGLSGTGLKFWNNGGNGLSVTANGTVPFTTLIASGGAYDVTVLTQPSTPTQNCVVSAPSGTIAGAGVTVGVACTTSSFIVGGTIAGLAGAAVILQDNTSTNTVSVSVDGTFAFPAQASGSAYAVTVATQPSSPTQSCTVANGSGTVTAAAITNIAVTCTTTGFTVGGTITGYAGSGLQLEVNGLATLSLAVGATSFTSAPLPSGQSYAISILTEPSSPTQSCTVASGTGTVTNANITSVAIACTTSTFTYGGTVGGLGSGETLVLKSGSNTATVTTDGALFSFPAIASGTAYSVTVGTQPSTPAQICTVANGSGTVTTANVTNIAVTCAAATYTVGGSISGLTSSGLVLLLNGANNLTVATGATTFTFTTPTLSPGAAYAVTIGTVPTGLSCSVTGGSGTVGSANVTSVAIACAIASQAAFTTPGSYTWVAPPGVTSVSVVVVGGGGGGTCDFNPGGGGGALSYGNSITVTPGSSYSLYVARGGNGGWNGNTMTTGGPGNTETDSGGCVGQPGEMSWFLSTTTLYAQGGGGYAGYTKNALFGGTASNGGGEGGTGTTYTGTNPGGAAGGGVGIMGGAAGGGGAKSTVNGCGGGAGGYTAAGGNAALGTGVDTPGAGGSGGATGGASNATYGSYGGLYGGGGGAGPEGSYASEMALGAGGSGGGGAVRIIWGTGRAFPDTNTGDM